MIEVRAASAVRGVTKSFIVLKDGKTEFSLTTSKAMTVDQLRETLAPPKKKERKRSR